MMAAAMLACQWLLACGGGLAAGLLTWLLLNGAARAWPALRTQRSVWLAAQLLVAAATLLPLLPRSAQLSVAPPIAMPASSLELGAMAPAPAMALPSTGSIDHMDDADAPAALAARALPVLAALWLPVYAFGLGWSLMRLVRARRLWRRLLAAAERLSPPELRAHGAFTPAQLQEIRQRRLPVLRTEAAISPMLIGVRRPLLVLPAHFDALAPVQQHMVIDHELQHLRRRDPLWLGIAAALQALFWFIPAMRWMARRMEWALELHCDHHVLAGRPQSQRKQYAAALLQHWKAQSLQPASAAAFDGATIVARLRQMQRNGLPAPSAAGTGMTAAALLAIVGAITILQPALAYSVPAAAQETLKTGAPELWQAPLEQVRVTGFFGVRRNVLPTPHKGIDFAAARGTPVHATAGGVVVAAGPIAENQGRYGNTVIIDHGGRRSLYAHLDSVSVRPGQRVVAGQHIGAVGRSGFATGPHLHLEMRQDGQAVDPAAMFANLDAHATPHALKLRRQQLPPKG